MTLNLEPRKSAFERRKEANQRVRKHRELERQGIACVTVQVTAEVLTMLVMRGCLANRCAHHRDEVNAGLSKYLHDQARDMI